MSSAFPFGRRSALPSATAFPLVNLYSHVLVAVLFVWSSNSSRTLGGGPVPSLTM